MTGLERIQNGVRVVLAVFFVGAGISHFVPILTAEYARMVPVPFTGSYTLVYVTGLMEIVFGLFLYRPKSQRWAGLMLIGLLLVLLNANIYAAVAGVTFLGFDPPSLWVRIPIQFILMGLIFWSAVYPETPHDVED